MHNEIVNFLNKTIPSCEAKEVSSEVGDSSILVSSGEILSVCRELRESLWEFNVLQVISGVDWKDKIEVNYILASFTKNHDLILKTFLEKNLSSDNHTPEIQSVTTVWASADWQERECYDMLGVRFIDHPDLRRILCPYDWEGYPLRKDYVVQEEYHGMKVNPEEKINSEDHDFCARLKENVSDPKRISGSWKSADEEVEGVQE